MERPGKVAAILAIVVLTAAGGFIAWRLLVRGSTPNAAGPSPAGQVPTAGGSERPVTRYTDQPAAPALGEPPTFPSDNKSVRPSASGSVQGGGVLPAGDEENRPLQPKADLDPDELSFDYFQRLSEAFQMAFLRVPAGKFTFGDLKGKSDERPPVEVDLNSFYISRNPVTIKDFRAFIVYDRGLLLPTLPSAYGQNESNPIVAVSWNDAEDYCRWIGEKINQVIGRQAYRGALPTETQWEKAARSAEDEILPPSGDFKEEWTSSGYIENLHDQIRRLGSDIEIGPPEEKTDNLAVVRGGSRRVSYARRAETLQTKSQKITFRVVLNKIES